MGAVMTKPWCERQREALAAFREAIVVRAQRERDIVEGEQNRARDTEQHYGAEKQRVETEYARAQAEAVTRVEQSRRRLRNVHDEQRALIKREFTQARDKILHDYKEDKTRQEGE